MKKLFPISLFIAIITCICVYSILRANYNWDVIGYVGSAYSIDIKDTGVVHQKTYESIRNYLNENNFSQLTHGSRYREELFTCAKCLYQTLPFYKIRPLYVILIYTMYRLNINIVFSAMLISGIFYFLCCIIIYLWLLKIFDNIYFTFFSALLISVIPYMLNSASICTPDSLSAFILILSVYFIYVKKNLYAAISLMILSVFARPDNIILLSIVCVILFFNKNFIKQKITAVLAFILGIISLFIVISWGKGYSYNILFYHSFIDYLVLPAEANISFGPETYLKGMLNWVFLFKYSFIAIQMFILFLTIYFKMIYNDKFSYDFDLLILTAMGTSILIHYVIHPMMNDRYFIAQYIAINLIFVKTIRAMVISQRRIT